MWVARIPSLIKTDRFGLLPFAIVFAVVALVSTIAFSQLKYISSEHHAIAASVMTFCSGTLIAILCTVLLSQPLMQYDRATSDSERRSLLNQMHMIGGMRGTAVVGMVVCGPHLAWVMLKAWLVLNHPQVVTDVELWVDWHYPYLLLGVAILITGSWLKWAYPLFEGAYGKDTQSMVSWIIVGVTIMYLSAFWVSHATVGWIQFNSEMFICLDCG